MAMQSFLGLFHFVLFSPTIVFHLKLFFPYPLIFQGEKKSSIWGLRPLEMSGLGIANDLPEITQTADLAKPILDLDTRQDRQRGRTWEGALKEKGSQKRSDLARPPPPFSKHLAELENMTGPTFLLASIEAVSSRLVTSCTGRPRAATRALIRQK